MIQTAIFEHDVQDLESQSPHSDSKRGEASIVSRYFKVITCALGITLVLVTLMWFATATHQDRRRLDSDSSSLQDSVNAKAGPEETKYILTQQLVHMMGFEKSQVEKALDAVENPTVMAVIEWIEAEKQKKVESAREDGWECPMCTYFNVTPFKMVSVSSICEMCGHEKLNAVVVEEQEESEQEQEEASAKQQAEEEEIDEVAEELAKVESWENDFKTREEFEKIFGAEHDLWKEEAIFMTMGEFLTKESMESIWVSGYNDMERLIKGRDMAVEVAIRMLGLLEKNEDIAKMCKNILESCTWAFIGNDEMTNNLIQICHERTS